MTNQMFNVVEDRGCDVQYLAFVGSFDECNEWMLRNTFEHPWNEDIRVHNNMYVNGNDDLFTYYITEESVM